MIFSKKCRNVIIEPQLRFSICFFQNICWNWGFSLFKIGVNQCILKEFWSEHVNFTKWFILDKFNGFFNKKCIWRQEEKSFIFDVWGTCCSLISSLAALIRQYLMGIGSRAKIRLKRRHIRPSANQTMECECQSRYSFWARMLVEIWDVCVRWESGYRVIFRENIYTWNGNFVLI